MKAIKSSVTYLVSALILFAFTACVKQQGKQQSASANSPASDTTIAYYHCGMHPQITSDKPGKCPICGMPLLPVYKSAGGNKDGIVTIDPAMVQNIGVKTEMIMKRKLTYTIRTTGTADYDEEKQTVITTKFSGWIDKLYANYTGEYVQKGEPLFEIYSPDLVAAQEEYLQSIKYGNSMRGANDSTVRTEAKTLLNSATEKLQYWDISDAQIEELRKSGIVKRMLTIYSPFSGTIIEKDIYEGMQAQAGMNLLKLADISQMWIYADIYENEMPWIKLGEEAVIHLPSMPGKAIAAKVSYIYPFVQDQTRTIKVRLSISNMQQELKKDMYVSVEIIPTVSLYALAIPEQSVIHSGMRNIAVLSLGGGKFKPVDITLGVLANGYYQVLGGLNEGDMIVTSSQFLIDSESNLKSAANEMGSMPGMNMGGMKGNPQKDTMQNMNGMKMN